MNYSSSLLSTRMIYVTSRTWNSGTDMAISLLHFTAFFQGEDKSIEIGENHYKSGHVEGFNYADGEIDGLVHASHREPVAILGGGLGWPGPPLKTHRPPLWPPQM